MIKKIILSLMLCGTVMMIGCGKQEDNMPVETDTASETVVSDNEGKDVVEETVGSDNELMQQEVLSEEEVSASENEVTQEETLAEEDEIDWSLHYASAIQMINALNLEEPQFFLTYEPSVDAYYNYIDEETGNWYATGERLFEDWILLDTFEPDSFFNLEDYKESIVEIQEAAAQVQLPEDSDEGADIINNGMYVLYFCYPDGFKDARNALTDYDSTEEGGFYSSSDSVQDYMNPRLTSLDAFWIFNLENFYGDNISAGFILTNMNDMEEEYFVNYTNKMD